jgi:hypothetical protein
VRFATIGWSLLSLLPLACGSSSPDPIADGGTYPAFAPDLPRIVDQGGGILGTPRIVTVTWDADPNASTFETFGDEIGASNFWKATTSEYGVGPATSGAANHVRIATAPQATMTDTALDSFIASHAGNGWPAPDAETVYVVYLPPSLELTSSGTDACAGEDGYHDETFTATNDPIVYAVIDERCASLQSADVLAFATETASHELVEAVTDPFTQSTYAWTGFDPDHYAWEVWTQKQDEVADACEYADDAYYLEQAPFAFSLQRAWSNASAAAGHDPCVPAPSTPNFDAVALEQQPIMLTVSTKPIATRGYGVLAGQTATVKIGLYSDAPTAPWSVSVVEGDAFTTPSAPHLDITQSAASGNNGDTIDVTITTKTTKASGVLVTIVSTQNGVSHYAPFLVATE